MESSSRTLATRLGDLALKVFYRLPLPAYPYRMYMHRHRCVFIHIPKNAGSSILNALGHKRGRDHVEWRHYRGANPVWFFRYHKFAICRDPLSRLRSAYEYVVRGGNQSPSDLALQSKVTTNSESLSEFIENVLDNEFIHEHVLFTPQYLFVTSPDGELKVDTLLRFETLAEDWNKLAHEKGFPTILNKTNETAYHSTTEIANELTEVALNKVTTLYRKDFDYFNYPVVK